jgi:hypothetical protein
MVYGHPARSLIDSDRDVLPRRGGEPDLGVVVTPAQRSAVVPVHGVGDLMAIRDHMLRGIDREIAA